MVYLLFATEALFISNCLIEARRSSDVHNICSWQKDTNTRTSAIKAAGSTDWVSATPRDLKPSLRTTDAEMSGGKPSNTDSALRRGSPPVVKLTKARGAPSDHCHPQPSFRWLSPIHTITPTLASRSNAQWTHKGCCTF